MVDSKEEAFRVAEEWDDQFSTVRTDGSIFSGGEMGAAIAFWTGKGWVKRGTYLGKNKEVFDAEAFAILQGVKLLNERAEAGRHYILFSYSQAAISRIRHDRCGPVQALAKAVITTVVELAKRDNTLCIRWTPAHRVVEGNDQADQTAKSGAEGKEERAEHAYLMQASLSYLTRKTRETGSSATSDWIRLRSGSCQRYRPPKNGKLRTGLAKARKEIAGRFYQLLSRHAATAVHLKRIGQSQTSRCWWCGSREYQT